MDCPNCGAKLITGRLTPASEVDALRAEVKRARLEAETTWLEVLALRAQVEKLKDAVEAINDPIGYMRARGFPEWPVDWLQAKIRKALSDPAPAPPVDKAEERPERITDHAFEPTEPTLKTEKRAAKLGNFPELCRVRPNGGAYRCGQPRSAHAPAGEERPRD